MAGLLVVGFVLRLPQTLSPTATPADSAPSLASSSPSNSSSAAGAATPASPESTSQVTRDAVSAVPGEPAGFPTIASAEPADGFAAPLENPAARAQEAGGIQPWSASQPRVKERLSHLLVGHQERVSTASIKGFLPYVTLVGYNVQP